MKRGNNFIVILAGGGGTRLWPKSRKNAPKQFLQLFNKKSLFQETIERVSGHFAWQNIFVVTGKDFIERVKREAPKLPLTNIIAEPMPKGTTAAVGLAAAKIGKINKEAIISTLAADHYIKEKSKFLKVLVSSQTAAARGNYIVTIGIYPTFAHTGFGYIQIDGEAFRVGKTPVFKVKGFKEKPDQVTAHAYFASGEFFWNANINSFKVSSILSSINKFVPALYKALESASKDGNLEFEKAWSRLPDEPIDTAILEKADNVLMIPGGFSWYDVGDWSTIYSILSRNPHENIVVGKDRPALLLDAEGSLIVGSKRLVAAIGIEDLIIVDTDDALLICPRSRAQEVKRIVERLNSDNKTDYL